jgi:hypothetical protein
MPEIGTSGSMSGEWKRCDGLRPQATAPLLDSTRAAVPAAAVRRSASGAFRSSNGRRRRACRAAVDPKHNENVLISVRVPFPTHSYLCTPPSPMERWRLKCVRRYGAMFSAFPAAVFNTLPRGCPVSAFVKVMASPCLSYFEHGLFGRSFQSVHPVLPFIVHVPCHITPFAVLYSAVPSVA